MSKFLGWCAVIGAAPILGACMIVCVLFYLAVLLLQVLWEVVSEKPTDWSWWNKGVCKRLDG